MKILSVYIAVHYLADSAFFGLIKILNLFARSVVYMNNKCSPCCRSPKRCYLCPLTYYAAVSLLWVLRSIPWAVDKFISLFRTRHENVRRAYDKEFTRGISQEEERDYHRRMRGKFR